MKPVQVKMMKRSYGDANFWCAYARGSNFGQFHTIEQAGAWMEHMVRAGFEVHPLTDVKPSGKTAHPFHIEWYNGHVTRIKEMIANHPRRGKSIWDPHVVIINKEK